MFKLRFSGDGVLKSPNVPCNTLDRKHTWSRTQPSGFYMHKIWIHTNCQPTLTRTQHGYAKCLENRHFMTIGDSNTRSFVNYLVQFLKLQSDTKTDKFMNFYFAQSKLLNVTISWSAHGMPWYIWDKALNSWFKPVSRVLDSVPANNNSIILIHLWLHMARVPVEVYRTKVHNIRISAEKLLQRSPEVTIVIKGPHSLTYKPELIPVDYLHRRYYDIWLTEFSGLHDKVIYLDFWDLSVAIDNQNHHPSQNIVEDMLYIFLSYICG